MSLTGQKCSELPFDGCSFYFPWKGIPQNSNRKKDQFLDYCRHILSHPVSHRTRDALFFFAERKKKIYPGKRLPREIRGRKGLLVVLFLSFPLFFADCHTGKKIWEVRGSALIFLVWFWQPVLLDKRDIPGIKEAAVQQTLTFFYFSRFPRVWKKSIVPGNMDRFLSWSGMRLQGRRGGRMGHLIPCPAFVKRGIFWEGGRKGACWASRQQRVIFSHRKIVEISIKNKILQSAVQLLEKKLLLFLS